MEATEVKEYTEGMIKNFCPGYTFKFSNGKRIGGYCNYRKRIISLSLPYTRAASQDEIFNTISHEIAHAIAGAREGHGIRWQQIHRSLGGNGKRCHSVTVTEGAKFFLACKAGCFVQPKFRKSKYSVERYRCGKCKGEVEIRPNGGQ